MVQPANLFNRDNSDINRAMQVTTILPRGKVKACSQGRRAIQNNGPWDDARLARDIKRAIEESKRTANLLDDAFDSMMPAYGDQYVRARNEEERKQEEEAERILAQEEQMRHAQNTEIEVPVECAVCMLVIVRPV